MGNELTAEQAALRETKLTEDARRRAGADPLPGPLAEAFLSDAIPVGENLSVRRVVASDWKILKALDSPIFKQMLEMQKDEKLREAVQYTDEEEWEMCWQFTHNPKDVRELFAKGREEFRRVAITEMGDVISIYEAKMIVQAIGDQILKSFATSIRYAASDSDTDEPAEKKTMTATH